MRWDQRADRPLLSLIRRHMEARRPILLASSGYIGYGSEESCVLHAEVVDMHFGRKKQFI